MPLVVNPSLEREPKRRKTDPSSSPNCDHWFFYHGICIACNSKVDKTKGRSFDYFDKGIQLSHEALSFTKRIISQTSWIENKKLHLVLDLDHTLVHSIRASVLSESDKYLKEEAVSRNDLWRYDDGFPSETLIKLRPFVHQFLKEASEMFTMFVYTKGGPDYAKLVLKLIDPDKVYFGDRVITKRECPGKKKTLDLVLADERGIVIVDDMRSVWPDHDRNLVQIAKYIYFRSNDDEGKELKGSCEKQRDESDTKGLLVSVLRFLKKIHKGFFSEKLGEEELDSIDVRHLINELFILRFKKAQSKGFGLKV